MWHAMFFAGVPLTERILRAILVYAFVVVGLRLAGKRELGQLNSLDLIVLLFLSNILQNAIIGNDNSVTGGIVGAATLLLVNYLTIRFLFRFPRLDRLIEGEARPLIIDGRVLHDNLKRELLTEGELLVACHKQGILDVRDVERAYLETGGAITVFAKQPSKPDTQAAADGVKLDAIMDTVQRVEQRLAALEH